MASGAGGVLIEAERATTGRELAAAFDATPSGTIGVEEELMLCSPVGFALEPIAEEALRALADEVGFHAELLAAQVEIVTPPVTAAGAVAERLRDGRARLAAVLGGRGSGAFADASFLWWDLRAHPRFGTLEVRVADVQTRVEDAVAIAALVQSLAAWLAERHDDGERLPVHDRDRIAQSCWLAARDG